MRVDVEADRAITSRSVLVATFAVAVVLLVLAGPVHSARAVVPAPGWKLRVEPYPSNLEAGQPAPAEVPPGYVVLAKNVGGGPTTGEFAITDVLPKGVRVNQSAAPEAHIGRSLAAEVPCVVEEAAGQQVVDCAAAGVVPAGEAVVVNIPIEVEATATGSLTNVAEAEGGGAEAVSAQAVTPITSQEPGFGFRPGPEGVQAVTSDAAGAEVTQAGTFPNQSSVNLAFPLKAARIDGESLRAPDGGVKAIAVELPPGTVVNPQATVQCTEVELESRSCPVGSQIGTITLITSLTKVPSYPRQALFNMKTPAGNAAVFGFEVLEGVYIHIIGSVRTDGDYGLSANIETIPGKIGFLGAETELWGIPSQAIHDESREPCLVELRFGKCETKRTNQPLLTTPTSCEGPLANGVAAVSWGSGAYRRQSALTAGMEGCNALAFDPTIRAQPTTNVADSPTGLDFDLHVPQAARFTENEAPPLATANFRDVTVTLPQGLALNPAGGNGLASCDLEQIGYAPSGGKIHFSSAPQSCPAAAKIGSVEVSTPLLDHKLAGSIYVAKPFANPFGSLLAIYLAIEDEESGIIAKLGGQVSTDPTTGQLTLVFKENPELPLEDVVLHLFNDSRAALTTPLSCAPAGTTSTITPWTTPEGGDAHPSDPYAPTVALTGTCPASEAAAPAAASFSAGTVAPFAGVYSPFVLRISRKDGTQHIVGIDTLLPEGLLGKLAGIPYCPESAIALARSRETPEGGKEEQGSPACPAASELGSVQVTAGSGVTPLPVSGHVYLAGPYAGAPISLVSIVPAVAGPFDLGDVVTRVALRVGQYDARIHAVSDPLPTIMQGIPLDLKSIELRLDRSAFTLNPTSCEAKSIEGFVSTQAGQRAPLKNGFQVGECRKLDFKPSFAVRLKGPTKRSGKPALRAVLQFPGKGTSANILKAQVSLPHSEFLEQRNIGTVCTQAQLLAHSCPTKSIYGHAAAYTPLLDQPLEGPVYLGAGFGHKLPDLVADLNGQIRVLLHGRIDTNKKGGIRTTFEAVPDAPVSKFVLELKGGRRYGLLVNSENICRKTRRADVKLEAQNGRVTTLTPKVAAGCGKQKHAKHKKTRHRQGKHRA